MGSVAFFLYAFSFLEHRPKYECLNTETGVWDACTNQVFCRFDLADGEGRVNPDV